MSARGTLTIVQKATKRSLYILGKSTLQSETGPQRKDDSWSSAASSIGDRIRKFPLIKKEGQRLVVLSSDEWLALEGLLKWKAKEKASPCIYWRKGWTWPSILALPLEGNGMKKRGESSKEEKFLCREILAFGSFSRKLLLFTKRCEKISWDRKGSWNITPQNYNSTSLGYFTYQNRDAGQLGSWNWWGCSLLRKSILRLESDLLEEALVLN